MKANELMTALHELIREEFVAITKKEGNKLYIRFLDGNVFCLSFDETDSKCG